MAYMQSPGIQVKEFDISGYVPGVSSSVAAIGGVFSWGPAEERRLITNENSLVLQFGAPTDDNYETFMIAANYLAYSDALYVSRAIDDSAFNAAAGEDVPDTQIKNLNDFTAQQGSFSANATFFAKYPSSMGNALTVSVCASAEAFASNVNVSNNAVSSLTVEFTPNSNTALLTVTDNAGNAAAATTELNAVVTKLTVGDFLTVQSNTSSVQYLRFNGTSNPTSDANTGTASISLNLGSRYTLASNTSMNYIRRNWEYFQNFDRAPGTSTYVAQRGGSGDELHMVVVDRTGVFTGNPNQILEIYPAASRATDSKSESGTTNYYKDLINDGSQYLWAVNDIAGVVSGASASMTPITVSAYTANLIGGTNSASESNISLASLANAYDQFKSKEDVDISLIIAGKAIGGLHGEGIANYIIDNIAEVRKDCVVTISPQLSDVVGAPFREVENLVEFRRSVRYSGRGFLSSAYKYQFDRYNQKNRWVAACGDDAGLMARTDFERDPWWSPAGQNRGIYKNVIRLAFNPDEPQRDALYKEDINPVVNQVGSGVILYGDKTLLGKPSAFDRINVRRLFDTLEKAIEKYSRALLFEFNDEYTRARFRNTVEPYLRDVMGRRGITRFKVICDDTNNTPVVIDRNEFIGSIFIVPAKSINYITLNFVAVANSVSFEYAIGEVQGS